MEQNSNIVPTIIWFDENINHSHSEIHKYLAELKREVNTQVSDKSNIVYSMSLIDSLNQLDNIFSFEDIKSGFEIIKKQRFQETFIIVGARLFPEFFKTFNENLKNIYIIPKIILFNPQRIIFPDEIKQQKYFNLYECFEFEGIKNIIEQEKMENKMNDIAELGQSGELDEFDKFTKIESEDDLFLTYLYSKLFDISETKNNKQFINDTYEKFNSEQRYYRLLKPLKSNDNIPEELLYKYYARLCSSEGGFYFQINKDLISGNKDNTKYQPYIKSLYDGVKKGILKTCVGTTLYASLKISENEMKSLYDCYNKKIKQLSIPTIFSNIFLSFSKDMKKPNNDRHNATLKITGWKKENDLNTHIDLEGISFCSDEKEVIFLPFSAFGIKDIQSNFDGKMKYIIELIYLGKYKEFNFNKRVDLKRAKAVLKKIGIIEEEKADNDIVKEMQMKFNKGCSPCCSLY